MRPIITADLPLENFTAELIDQIIVHNLHEDHVLEFKDVTQGSVAYKVRQAIGSLGNADGGFVLCGIRDAKDRSVEDATDITQRLAGLPENIQEFGTWVDGIVQDTLLVPAVLLQTQTVTVATKQVGVIKVEASKIGPLGVRKEASAQLEFWKRGEQSKVRMSYPDLRTAYRTSVYEHLLCIIPVLIRVGIFFVNLTDTHTKRLGKDVGMYVTPYKLYFSVLDKMLVTLEGDPGLTEDALILVDILQGVDVYLQEFNQSARDGRRVNNRLGAIKDLRQLRDDGRDLAVGLARGLGARYPEAKAMLNIHADYSYADDAAEE